MNRLHEALTGAGVKEVAVRGDDGAAGQLGVRGVGLARVVARLRDGELTAQVQYLAPTGDHVNLEALRLYADILSRQVALPGFAAGVEEARRVLWMGAVGSADATWSRLGALVGLARRVLPDADALARDEGLAQAYVAMQTANVQAAPTTEGR